MAGYRSNGGRWKPKGAKVVVCTVCGAILAGGLASVRPPVIHGEMPHSHQEASPYVAALNPTAYEAAASGGNFRSVPVPRA